MDNRPADFWQDHSLQYLEMAFKKDKCERIENPDGYGKRIGDCGDSVEIFLRVRDNIIEQASYDANGCLNTHACANTVIHLAEGKSINEAWEITVEKVVDYLQTLPKEEIHCAELAVGALYLALRNYRDIQKSPWLKLYSKT